MLVFGLTQEQHPARCELFAQWKGLDWPILWDPFNLTRTKAVPRVTLIDEHGRVVKDNARIDDAVAFFEEEREVDPGRGGRLWIPGLAAGDELGPGLGLPSPLVPEDGDAVTTALALGALDRCLVANAEAMVAAVPNRTDFDFGIRGLSALAEEFPDDPLAHWRLGVALRMRHDSPHRQPDDFARAVEHWRAALALEPSQYIWRRRIQQYGPRLDKPYPFYDWVDEARAEITARGETPVALPVPLTGTERLGPSRDEVAAAEATEPDPDGGIPRDEDGWLTVQAVVVPDTQGREGVSRLHLELVPDAGRRVHWNNEADPVEIWLGAPELPEGVAVTERRLRGEQPPEPVSSEPRHFDLELRHGTEAAGAVLTGYALFYACEDVDGQCVYLRHDFEVPLPD